MQPFIEVFNANRHWILPIILAGVVSLLVRELKIFFMPPSLDPSANSQSESVMNLGDLPRNSLPPLQLFSRLHPKGARGKFQLGSAVLFHDTRFNDMK